MASDLVLDIYLAAHDQFSSVFEKLGVAAEGLSGKIGLVSGAFGVLAGGALAESVKQASDYQAMIQHVAANTTMTTSGIKEMDAAIQDMAAHSSAHMEDLAQAWMHVTDLGFTKAADAQKVVQAAMESALSTGGNVVDTANVLANAMHEFSLKASDAGHAMDVLHLASAEGNTTLEDFVDGAGRAIGMAANLGVSLTDAGAAISALTRHGFDASTASTQLIGMLEHITNPASKARDEIAALSKRTGIDLVHDFSQAGLHAKGLSGVLADVQQATRGNASEIEKLIPALRGGLGAMTLTGTGAADFTAILKDLNDTMAGKSNPTAEAYARTQQTLSYQLGVLKNNLQEMAIAIGTAVLPALTKLTSAAVPVIQHIADWMKHHGALVAGLLAGVAVVGTLTGALLILGPVIGALVSPIGLVVLAIGGAIAGLVAFATHSRGFRDLLAGVWSGIADDAGHLWSWLTGIWNGISGDAQLLWENLGSWLQDTWHGIVTTAGPIWHGLVTGMKYIWDRITGDKNAAGADLQKVPTEWRPLVQAIGDVLSGSWFTVKYIWDTLFGSHQAATNDLKGIPPEWRPLVQAIGDVLSGSFWTAKYIWDDFWGNHNAATADLGKIPPEWRPLVQAIGDTLRGSFFTVKYLWDDLWGNHNAATNDLKKIPPEWQPLVKAIGATFDRLGPAVAAAFKAAGQAAKDGWDRDVKPHLHDMKGDWDRFVKDLGPLLKPAGDHVGTALKAVGVVLGAAMNVVLAQLKAIWKAFWDGLGTFVSHGLSLAGDALRHATKGLEEAILVVTAAVALKWDKAWEAMKQIPGDALGFIGRVLRAGATAAGDAMAAVTGVMFAPWTLFISWIEEHLLSGAIHWGETMIHNFAQGIKNKMHEGIQAMIDFAKELLKHIPHLSPAEKGPLSAMPDFGYIAEAIHATIPQVRAAGTQLMAATGLGGGALGLDISTSGGVAPRSAGGVPGGHSVAIAPTIHINGGTFTDRQSIADLAHKVSEEIMHSVRMQGGLLPQI